MFFYWQKKRREVIKNDLNALIRKRRGAFKDQRLLEEDIMDGLGNAAKRNRHKIKIHPPEKRDGHAYIYASTSQGQLMDDIILSIDISFSRKQKPIRVIYGPDGYSRGYDREESAMLEKHLYQWVEGYSPERPSGYFSSRIADPALFR